RLSCPTSAGPTPPTSARLPFLYEQAMDRWLLASGKRSSLPANSQSPIPIANSRSVMKPYVRIQLALLFMLLLAVPVRAEDGYELWLRYRPVADAALQQQYRSAISGLLLEGDSPTIRAAREELARGLSGLLGVEVPVVDAAGRDGLLVAGTPAASPFVAALNLDEVLAQVGDEGYVIRSAEFDGRRATVIAANTDIGVLYGAFHLLRLLQTHQPID